MAIQNYEPFSSVSILLDCLDDKPRHLMMAIYQLSEMGLLLAEKVLDNERAIEGSHVAALHPLKCNRYGSELAREALAV